MYYCVYGDIQKAKQLLNELLNTHLSRYVFEKVSLITKHKNIELHEKINRCLSVCYEQITQGDLCEILQD